MDQSIRIRPSRWTCLWGLPFALIGGGLFAYTLFHGLTHITDSLTQIVVPGSKELSLQQGRYSVFLEEQSVVDGKVYSTTQSVGGLTCRVNSVQNDSSIAIKNAGTSTSYNLEGRSGHSVLEFSIQQSGQYLFACGYEKNVKGPEVVVAVGSGVSERIFQTVIASLASLFGGFGGVVIVVLIVELKRNRAKKLLWQSGQTRL